MVKLRSPGWYLTRELWLRKASGFWNEVQEDSSCFGGEMKRQASAQMKVDGQTLQVSVWGEMQSRAALRHSTSRPADLLSADAVFGTFWARPMNFNPTGTKSMSCHNHLLQPEHAGCDWETLTIANIFFWADSIQTYLLVGREFQQSFYKGFNVWKIKIKLDLLFLYLKRQIINHS